MSYALGVDVGTSYTAAAIWRLDGQQQSTEVVPLGSRMPSVSSVLFLGPDGSFVVGEAAERRSVTDPDRVVREFKRRIGDDTPLFVGGRPYAAHDLAAMMVRWVVDRVVEREGGAPDQIAITHPAGWGPFKKDLLRTALGAQGLHNLTFLAEPEAAAVSYAAQERVEAGTTIAVYDLGGGTFDAAVVRKTGASKTGAGSFALMGSADGIEQLGGADFDEAVFTHVQAGLGDRLDALDIDDPSVLSGLARLRRECTEAKEALSSDTEVSVAVLLPGVNAQVRLVRSEFEEMIRPALEDTIDSLSRAIASAGLTSADLGAVLLVGGSSRVPLVSQMVSARLGCPVVVDADPKTTIALGAALSMAPQPEPLTTGTPTAIVPVPQPADPEPDLVNGSGRHLPGQAPDRPIVPTRQEYAELPGSDDEDGPPRRRLLAGVMSGVVAVALIVGAVLALPAVTADPTSPAGAPATAPATAEPGDSAKISPAGGALQSRGRDGDSATSNPPAQQPGAPATTPPAPAGTAGGRGTTPAPAPTTTTPPPPPPTTTTKPPPPPPTTTTEPPPPPPPPTTTTTEPPPPPPTTTTTEPPLPPAEEPPAEQPTTPDA
ncbi:MAG: Hsp70 family protein [Pseudonocardiaceae bacterium]